MDTEQKISQIVSVKPSNFPDSQKYEFKLEGSEDVLSCFSKFPLQAGQVIFGHIELNGRYKNWKWGRKGSGTQNSAPGAMKDGDVARVMNALNFKVLPVLEAIHGRLGLVLKALDVKVDDGKVEYPTHVATEFDEPIVTRDDVPFD